MGTLNEISKILISFYSEEKRHDSSFGITVSPIVSKLAEWYEKLRNAMEYRQEEVVFQGAIKRILTRKLLIRMDASIAEALTRELVWAKYVPDNEISDLEIQLIDTKINLFLELKKQVAQKKILRGDLLNEWIVEILSSDLTELLTPNQEKEAMINYIFHALEKNISVEKEDDETKNIQLYIAVRRMYAKENNALLRHSLFKQYFGELTEHTLPSIVEDFENGYKNIEGALNHYLKHKMQSYVKKFIPPFLILDQLLHDKKSKVHEILENKEELNKEIDRICREKYRSIQSKVNRAILRSFIFVAISKVFFGFTIEGTYERIMFGHIVWLSLILNIVIPVTVMAISVLFMKQPKEDNTKKIQEGIDLLLFSEFPVIGYKTIIKNPKIRRFSIIQTIFWTLSLFTYILSFGVIVYLLKLVQYNIVSIGVFLFFFAIISFLIYRIYQTSKTYSYLQRQSLRSLLVDFFFLPIAQVGRHLTEGISQVNFMLFVFDFIIETPFKALFQFFDQWFLYLHSRRESMD
jgi:hypothetical protein